MKLQIHRHHKRYYIAPLQKNIMILMGIDGVWMIILTIPQYIAGSLVNCKDMFDINLLSTHLIYLLLCKSVSCSILLDGAMYYN